MSNSDADVLNSDHYRDLWYSLSDQVRRMAIDGSTDEVASIAHVVDDIHADYARHVRHTDHYLQTIHRHLHKSTHLYSEVENSHSTLYSTELTQQLTSALADLRDAKLRLSQCEEAEQQHRLTAEQIRLMLQQVEHGSSSIDGNLVEAVKPLIENYHKQQATFERLRKEQQIHAETEHELVALRGKHASLQENMRSMRQKLLASQRQESMLSSLQLIEFSYEHQHAALFTPLHEIDDRPGTGAREEEEEEEDVSESESESDNDMHGLPSYQQRARQLIDGLILTQARSSDVRPVVCLLPFVNQLDKKQLLHALGWPESRDVDVFLSPTQLQHTVFAKLARSAYTTGSIGRKLHKRHDTWTLWAGQDTKRSWTLLFFDLQDPTLDEVLMDIQNTLKWIKPISPSEPVSTEVGRHLQTLDERPFLFALPFPRRGDSDSLQKKSVFLQHMQQMSESQETETNENMKSAQELMRRARQEVFVPLTAVTYDDVSSTISPTSPPSPPPYTLPRMHAYVMVPMRAAPEPIEPPPPSHRTWKFGLDIDPVRHALNQTHRNRRNLADSLVKRIAKQ